MFRIVGSHQDHETRRVIHSLIFPSFMVLLMFVARLIEEIENWDLYFLGVKPLTIEGLPGIALMPFVHASWGHFLNNAISFLLLAVTLFYFYRGVAYRVFVSIYFLAGAWLWFGGRDAWHVGASGLVYGIAAFLFVSGILRRHVPLMAIALVVTLFYGNMVWGMLPLANFMPHSWEGHFWGFLAGIVVAWVFRNDGPVKPQAPADDPLDDTENPYWLNDPVNVDHDESPRRSPS